MTESSDTSLDTNERSEDVKSGYSYWKKIRGSDPHGATCRGKLQFQRAKLNQEINHQTKMRNGAEKLYRATTNKKLKETVALELSFINSSLQLLKEQLADLNSSVQLYQNNSHCATMPMIPLGLKETKQIDFRDTFKDFILMHYSEDDAKYDSAIQQLNQIRQAVRTPSRDQAGVKLLFQYYNLLYFVDKRFFSAQKHNGLYFEWFDSLTGLPSMQKSVAFEKASVLFNIASLYTQIGAKQDRTKSGPSESATDSFLRAAGTIQYLKEHFGSPPGKDLSPEALDALQQLMLAQARECLFDKVIAELGTDKAIPYLDVAREAAEMKRVYQQLLRCINLSLIKDIVPNSWSGLIELKVEHYTALSHHYVALGLFTHQGECTQFLIDKLESLCIDDPSEKHDVCPLPTNTNERLQLARAHNYQAIIHHEEALRWYRMCRQVQLIDGLFDILHRALHISMDLTDSLDYELDQFEYGYEVKPVRASTKFQLKLAIPDFLQFRVADLFKGLGPLKFFSARRHWTAAREVELKKSDENTTFGFSVKDDAPVVITRVEVGSIAEACGLKEGDYITAVNDQDTKWSTHDEMAKIIKSCGNCITLKLVTPMDWKYLRSSRAGLSVSSQSTTSSSSGVSSTSSRNPSPVGSISSKDSDKWMTWNPFRRKNSKDPLQSSYVNNVQYR